MGELANVKREDVLNAVKEIDEKGYPPKYESIKYELFVNNKRYPIKYVLSLATKYANGDSSQIPSTQLYPQQTIDVLEKLGFEILLKESFILKLFEFYDEYTNDLLNDSLYKEILKGYNDGRRLAFENFETLKEIINNNLPVTIDLIFKLTPHPIGYPHTTEVGGWPHPTTFINHGSDIVKYLKSKDKNTDESIINATGGLAKFYYNVLEKHEPLEIECTKFINLNIKGLQTGFISPFLSAIDPEHYVIITSQTLKVINCISETKFSSQLSDYPELNKAGIRLIKSASNIFERNKIPGATNHDLFSIYCYWLFEKKHWQCPKRPESLPVPQETPNIWWVNQGLKLKEEAEGGYIWAPLKRKDGSTPYYYSLLTEIKKDDIILHYSNTNLRFVSRVLETSAITKRPNESYSENWEDSGNKVKLKYYELNHIIPLSKFNIPLTKLDFENGQGPIQLDGGVKEGYLFRFSREGLRIIQECQNETEWPDFVNDSDIYSEPNDNIITNEFDEYYLKNREAIDKYNYVRRPKSNDHWAYIAKNKLDDYKQKYGNKFNIIISGQDNYWIIPYEKLEQLFIDDTLKIDKYNRRWFTHIKNDEFYLKSENGVNISDYRNNLKLFKLPSHNEPLTWGDIKNNLSYKFDREISIQNSLFYDEMSLKNILQQVNTALKNGKHIILIGPPGTGKSKLAKLISEAYCGKENYFMCTATSDWSTFETIGGYRLNKQNELVFFPGIFLQCFRDKQNQPNNRWLIIDEINRADIDKAFGSLFSALTGDDTCLPYITNSTPPENIEIIGNPTDEMVIKDNRYFIPDHWRIIATMNTFDKSSLYEMSYAFIRRFAFIPIDVPNNITPDLLTQLVKIWGVTLDPITINNIADLWRVINSRRKMGPAIIEDLCRYFEVNPEDYTGALIMYIMPQFEGLPDQDQINFIKEDLAKFKFINDMPRLENFASDYLGVRFK